MIDPQIEGAVSCEKIIRLLLISNKDYLKENRLDILSCSQDIHLLKRAN